MARMPKEGFLKVVAPQPAKINPSEKAALIRKANQLFSSGEITTAKKIFITLKHCSGLIRIGDYHYKHADFFEAYRMYALAPAPAKLSHMIEKMAGVIKQWVNEENETN